MNRAGQYISNMTGEAAYQSFCPTSLPPQPALDISDDILRLLMELDILRETTNAARNRVFAYEKYLAILRDGT